MDLATVIEILREDYGITDSSYSDDQLTRFINKAVEKISQYYPMVEIGQTETVAEQTRYQITASNLIKIKNVAAEPISNNNSTVPPNPIPEIGINGPVLPASGLSSGFAMLQTLELYKKIYPCDVQIVAHDTFEILPTPDRDGYKIIYEYERYRTIEELPKMFEEDLVDLILFFIGDKNYKSSTFTGQTNTYWFDRRGNQVTRTEGDKKSIVELRDKMFKDIIHNIQKKVQLI